MQSINDVFAELDNRIDKLRNYDASFSIWDKIEDNFSVAQIERNIYKFENDAIHRVDITLGELKELENLGRSIIEKVDVHEEWDWGGKPVETSMTIDRKREEIYDTIRKELSFYINKLSILKNALKTRIVESSNQKPSITIGADFDFPKLKREKPEITQTTLNKEQSALLFHYLMEKNAILYYDAKSISKIVSMLTGFSDETLRQDAFGHIHEIKKAIPKTQTKGNKLTNIEILKNILSDIIQEIDNTVKKPSK